MVSKKMVPVYECDRCGKQMEVPYGSISLKRSGVTLERDSIINKDLCEDCFKLFTKLFGIHKAAIVNLDQTVTTVNSPFNGECDSCKDTSHVAWLNENSLNKQSGTWKTEPLNKHLNVTCI